MSNDILKTETREKLLATGGILGAVAASSCCVLPLLFVSIGVSGAWIGHFTHLAPYRPIFLTLAMVFIAAGFWSVYRRNEPVCEGSACETSNSRRFTKAALWLGFAILVLAATAEWWATLLN
jgi:mercuric ion transport protein